MRVESSSRRKIRLLILSPVQNFSVNKGMPIHRRSTPWVGVQGGLLMGAVMNLRPDLFHGMVAQVPFVDVVTTMLDASIPLTTGEYDEWGDPNQRDYYDYMLSYSPYDNVKAAGVSASVSDDGFT